MATFYIDDAPMGDRYFIDGGSFSREEFERRRETEWKTALSGQMLLVACSVAIDASLRYN